MVPVEFGLYAVSCKSV